MKWIFMSVVLLLAACVPVTGSEPAQPEVNLEGTRWMLESMNGTPVVPGSDVTLQFDADNQAGGHGGCNSYGGAYTLTNDNIEFENLAQTLMACLDEDLNQQESAYMDALNNARTVSMENDRLTITYDDGQLNFVRVQE